MRYKITIEYDGTNFAGWQKQNHENSIQQTIERAIYKFSQQKVTLYGSGRTDAGVHAIAQVAHFDLIKEFDCFKVQNAINHHLKKSTISITQVVVVDESFHARFSAIKRYYKYRIINRKSPLALDKLRAWCVFQQLNVDNMKLAAKALIGTHNFNSFRSTNCQAKNPIKTIDTIEIINTNELIEIYVSARSFLHNQVRIIVGTLKEVGINQHLDISNILHAQDRTSAGITAPPHGLYLIQVDY